LCFFDLVGVDPVVIESRADEMVAPVSKDEYKALVSHLNRVRRNWVFHALGLSAPQWAAEAKLAEGQGTAPTSALEKAKRKQASSTVAPKKKGRILDDILQQSPLRSKGDSEDGLSGDSNRPSTEAPPFAQLIPKRHPCMTHPPPVSGTKATVEMAAAALQIAVVTSSIMLIRRLWLLSWV
jgi:hypothetical protein